MSLRMKALKSFRLPRQRINPGDVFPVKDSDVRMLAAAQLAEVVDDGKETKQGQASRRAHHARRRAARNRAAPDQAKPAAKAREKNLDVMTMAELRAHAKKQGVEIPPGLRKAEVLIELRRGLYGRRDMRAV